MPTEVEAAMRTLCSALLGTILLSGIGTASAAVAATDGRPNCPDYVEHNKEWVQFGFFTEEGGASWSKTATMTQRDRTGKNEAIRLARQLQICFQAPYSFPTRPGYRLGRSGDEYVGVLPDCRSRQQREPCLFERLVLEDDEGWYVQMRFLVPPSEKDPKAMG